MSAACEHCGEEQTSASSAWDHARVCARSPTNQAAVALKALRLIARARSPETARWIAKRALREMGETVAPKAATPDSQKHGA